MKPLSDILVIDLTRVLAGPYATMILRNLGARVIKVERPVVGDDSRHFGPFHNGESAYFASISAGKESMTLDLKAERGKEILKALVEKADVLVENFKPGVMEKLGLGYDTLREINPRLVYAAASGFGHTGPISQRPAYDMIVQAAGGIMSITGLAGGEGPPVRVGTSVGDITASLFAGIGIMTALYRRTFTGEGAKIDVAMLDCQVAILENAIARCDLLGEPPGPLGTAHPSITPFQAFKTRDSWIIVAAGNDKLFENLCLLLDRKDLLERDAFKDNDSRTENRDALVEEIGPAFREKTTKEWYDLLDGKVPASPINTVDRVMAHPQVLARKMIVQSAYNDGRPLRIAGNPIKMTDLDDETTVPPSPLLGQHTDAILADLLSLSSDEIGQLHDQKVV